MRYWLQIDNIYKQKQYHGLKLIKLLDLHTIKINVFAMQAIWLTAWHLIYYTVEIDKQYNRVFIIIHILVVQHKFQIKAHRLSRHLIILEM